MINIFKFNKINQNFKEFAHYNPDYHCNGLMYGINIIVSYYNENLDWIINNNLQDYCIIYNKSDHYYTNSIKLNNVGREGHTYLYHIINNYNNLNDINIFTQGNPFDHCNDFINKVHNINIGYNTLSNNILNIKNYKCDNHENIPIKEICDNLKLNTNGYFDFGTGAIFSVDKDTILKHPLEFYKQCIQYLENDINPIQGYVFERIWKLIFLYK